MEFLDDVISKTKDVFEVAYKKTEEVVTLEKIKFDIASLKAKRDKDYIELGKIYFKQIKDVDKLSEDEQKIVEKIIQKNEKIKELNEEIERQEKI